MEESKSRVRKSAPLPGQVVKLLPGGEDPGKEFAGSSHAHRCRESNSNFLSRISYYGHPSVIVDRMTSERGKIVATTQPSRDTIQVGRSYTCPRP